MLFTIAIGLNYSGLSTRYLKAYITNLVATKLLILENFREYIQYAWIKLYKFLAF